MVLDFEPGQAAYDVDAMESPAEHPDAADARQRRKAGPAPVTLISCLEASCVLINYLVFCLADRDWDLVPTEM